MSTLVETVKDLAYDKDGLVPAVCVDAQTRQVLMVAYMNQAALLQTVKTGKTHFWSRSRQEYWMKGQTSGHTQQVKAIYVDCDKDTLLIEVIQNVAACHLGYYSCFFRKLNDQGQWESTGAKVFDPDKVYADGKHPQRGKPVP
jgi:phosphoribosyl-AMP cyclohydrolase